MTEGHPAPVPAMTWGRACAAIQLGGQDQPGQRRKSCAGLELFVRRRATTRPGVAAARARRHAARRADERGRDRLANREVDHCGKSGYVPAASQCGAACDFDGGGWVTVSDARHLVRRCTWPTCAPQ
jgi:hypothetical protein